ncbi:pur operon repressor [Holzapfeliella sp. JNUCC 80]
MKRSERLIDMTQYLLSKPHTLISLPFFANKYDSAKSSISEDLSILRKTLATNQNGYLQTIAGAAGGVRYIPFMGRVDAINLVEELIKNVDDEERILPGGFLYLSDIIGNPQLLQAIGKLIATHFAFSDIDVVMTVETKGAPLAAAVASFLNVPYVIVRRKPKITEGPTISVNYVSSSGTRFEKMELAKRSLKPHSNVLIVDDFMKGGGTINGMVNLVNEFDANVSGISVLCEAKSSEKSVADYVSLLNLEEVDPANKEIKVNPGNVIERTNFEVF